MYHLHIILLLDELRIIDRPIYSKLLLSLAMGGARKTNIGLIREVRRIQFQAGCFVERGGRYM